MLSLAGTNSFAIGKGKVGLRVFIEILLVLCLLLWSWEVLGRSMKIDVSILPGFIYESLKLSIFVGFIRNCVNSGRVFAVYLGRLFLLEILGEWGLMIKILEIWSLKVFSDSQEILFSFLLIYISLVLSWFIPVCFLECLLSS
jgi:hypothetical protein